MEYKANNHLLVSSDGKLSLPRRSECIRYLSSASLRKDSYIQIASEVIVCPITFTNGSYLLTNSNSNTVADPGGGGWGGCNPPPLGGPKKKKKKKKEKKRKKRKKKRKKKERTLERNPFKCKYCEKIFNSSGNLTKHMITLDITMY